MNVNFNLGAAASQWVNPHAHQTETTGAIANNRTNNFDPIFKQRNTETTGAVAMFNGVDQSGHFSAVA